MSLEKLAEMQYRLTAEKNRLSKERSEEISKCLVLRSNTRISCGMKTSDDISIDSDEESMDDAVSILSDFAEIRPENLDNCYSAIMREMKSGSVDYYDRIDFDEALYTYGCSHCQKARTLKREIGRIGRQLGQVRGQITLYGKRFSEQSK